MVFIPYSDPIKIAKVLDYKRLGKQRVEARQILSIILGEAKWTAWRHHPAVLMWTPYPNQLKYYYNIMIKEWISRGYENNMVLFDDVEKKMPWFMHCEPILLSHRATLLRKNYAHYIQYFTAPKTYLEYGTIWPIIGDNYLTKEQISALKNKKKIRIDNYAVLFKILK